MVLFVFVCLFTRGMQLYLMRVWMRSWYLFLQWVSNVFCMVYFERIMYCTQENMRHNINNPFCLCNQSSLLFEAGKELWLWAVFLKWSMCLVSLKHRCVFHVVLFICYLLFSLDWSVLWLSEPACINQIIVFCFMNMKCNTQCLGSLTEQFSTHDRFSKVGYYGKKCTKLWNSSWCLVNHKSVMNEWGIWHEHRRGTFLSDIVTYCSIKKRPLSRFLNSTKLQCNESVGAVSCDALGDFSGHLLFRIHMNMMRIMFGWVRHRSVPNYVNRDCVAKRSESTYADVAIMMCYCLSRPWHRHFWGWIVFINCETWLQASCLGAEYFPSWRPF